MSTEEENRVIVEVPAHEPEPEKVMTLRRAVIWVFVIAAFVVLAGSLLDRPDLDSKTVPEVLVGDWTSDHPEYSDRYLEITATSITFGTGGTSFVRYSILGAEIERGEGVDIVVLHFRDVAGTKFKRSVVLGSSGTTMHFASQPEVVWQRFGT